MKIEKIGKRGKWALEVFEWPKMNCERETKGGVRPDWRGQVQKSDGLKREKGKAHWRLTQKIARVLIVLFIWEWIRVCDITTAPFTSFLSSPSSLPWILNSVLLAQGQPVPPLLPLLQDQSGDGYKVWFLGFMFYAFLFNLGKN